MIIKDKRLDKPIGEIGIDPEASPGNGPWFVKHYASGYDVVGFDTEDEAFEEFEYVDNEYARRNEPNAFGEQIIESLVHGMH